MTCAALKTLMALPLAAMPERMEGHSVKVALGAITALGLAFALPVNAHAACVMEKGSTPEDGACAVTFNEAGLKSDE